MLLQAGSIIHDSKNIESDNCNIFGHTQFSEKYEKLAQFKYPSAVGRKDPASNNNPHCPTA
jgi:hypothetical protein